MNPYHDVSQAFAAHAKDSFLLPLKLFQAIKWLSSEIIFSQIVPKIRNPFCSLLLTMLPYFLDMVTFPSTINLLIGQESRW